MVCFALALIKPDCVGATFCGVGIGAYNSDSIKPCILDTFHISHKAERKVKVTARVYDITGGMASVLAPMLIGRPLDGIWHTGIGCFGKEYFFGKGICVSPEGKAVPLPASHVIEIGYTVKTEKELKNFLRRIMPRWTGETYHLINHNCNHFADEVAKFLTGSEDCLCTELFTGYKGIPEFIHRTHDEVLNTPLGQRLRPMIEDAITPSQGATSLEAHAAANLCLEEYLEEDTAEETSYPYLRDMHEKVKTSAAPYLAKARR